jgi:tetratricopeptide (TPR) repeat protein
MNLSALTHAANHGRLIVLAGAGISVAPPSHLPDWYGFYRVLLAEIQALALEVVPDAKQAIERLDLDQIDVAAFSDRLVRYCAGDSYFPILEVLDSDRPNANHLALAELASRHQIAAILTTNFDTLIEAAFRLLGIPLRVLAGRSDFKAIRYAPPCALFKLHGSVTAASTLVDTVSQKLRGLSDYVRAALAVIPLDYHLLVIGFSGADLKFGPDYIPLLAPGRAVTWITQPGRSLLPHVKERLGDIGGNVVEATLRDVFTALGATYEETAADPAAAAAADDRARASIARWVRRPNIGPWTCAAFCAELLDDIGEASAAREIGTSLERALRDAAELPPAVGIVYRVLSRFAAEDGEAKKTIAWCDRELSYWQQVADAVGANEQPATRRERLSGIASALTNIAVAEREDRRFDAAKVLLRAARTHALDIASADLLAEIELNLAILANESQMPQEIVLEHARNATAYATDAGFAMKIHEARLLAAATLTSLGEYSAAWHELDAARQLKDIAARRPHLLEAVLRAADLHVRRNEASDAVREIEEARRLASGPEMRDAITMFTVPRLAYARDLHDWLHRLLDDALPGMPAEPSLRNLLADPPDHPLLEPVRQDAHAPQVRWHLLEAEFRGDSSACAGLLKQLLRDPSLEPRPRRRLDVALALIAAAQGIGDRDAELEAWNHAGVAHDALGDWDASERAFRRMHELAQEPQDRAAAAMNLGVAVSRRGPASEAHPLFEEADGLAADADSRLREQLQANWARHRARYALDARQEPPNPQIAAAAPTDPNALVDPEDLGNRGLEELLRGNVPLARELIGRAMKLYEALGFELGISRCLNNLSDCASIEGDFGEAVTLARRALEIRRRIGDVEGEALTRAALAWHHIHLHAPEQALEEAVRVRLLLRNANASFVSVKALAAEAAARALLGQAPEARRIARRALMATIEDQHLRSIEPLLRELAAEPAEPKRTKLGAAASSEAIGRMVEEARHAKNRGEFELALTLLRTASDAPAATPLDLAIISGECAEVLQRANRDGEAAAEYTVATRLLRSEQREDLAQVAICEGAASLRKTGRLAESEQQLRTLQAAGPVAELDAKIRITLANTLLAQVQLDTDAVDAELRWDEAARLLDEAANRANDDEEIGAALLTLAQMQRATGAFDLAMETARQAREAFLQINSRHVESARMLLEQFERQAAEGSEA